MFMMKVQEWLSQGVDFVTNLYHHQDVQGAIAAAKQTANDVVAWVRKQVKEQPEATVAGAIVAWVTLIVISTFTVGLVLTVLFACAVAAGAHYYFHQQAW